MKRLLSLAIDCSRCVGAVGRVGAEARRRAARARAALPRRRSGETLDTQRDRADRDARDACRTPTCSCATARSPAVGPEPASAGADARVIDATGKFVLPGIIDAHSHSMMDGSVNECTLVRHLDGARCSDILNPTDVNLYRELAGGTTPLLLLHGSCNAIGGQSTTVKIKWGHPVADFPFPGAPPGIKFALGENPKRTNFNVAPASQRAATRRRAWASKRPSATPSRARATTSATWDEYRAALARRTRT